MVCPFAVLRSRFGFAILAFADGGSRNSSLHPPPEALGISTLAQRSRDSRSVTSVLKISTPCSNCAQAKSSVLKMSTELFTELSPYYFPQTFALRSAFTKTGASKIETTTAKTALIPEVISFVLHESAAALASLPLSISVINDLPMMSTM